MQKVYIELVFIDNFIVNLLIILLASRLTKTPVRWQRCCLAAALGGVYGCAAVSLSGWLETLAVKIAAGFGMCLTAWLRRGERGFWKNACAFWAASFLLAGAVVACALGFGEPAYLGGAVVAQPPARYILLGLLVGAALLEALSRAKQRAALRESRSAMLTLTLEQRRVTVKAFADTGNLARDPLSQKSVIFLSRSAAKELLGDALLALITRRAPTPTKRLRIVPCITAAGQRLFYGVELDGVALRGEDKRVRAVACVSPQPLPDGYGAIAGQDLLDELSKGAKHEDAVVTKADRPDNAEAEAGGACGLHQRERGAAAAADARGGGDAAAAAGGGRQIGQTGAH